jgi:GMP synthase-like glutamine amidotransferase
MDHHHEHEDPECPVAKDIGGRYRRQALPEHRGQSPDRVGADRVDEAPLHRCSLAGPAALSSSRYGESGEDTWNGHIDRFHLEERPVLTVRIGLLRCDEVGGDRAERFGGYKDLYSNLLRAVDPNVAITDYDVVEGQLPTDPGEQDGWLISGSRASTYDDAPWLDDLSALLVRLNEAGVPTVGICFGHQALAHALGGKVAMAAGGWGIGIHQAEMTAPSKWMLPERQQFGIAYSHKDQVTDLPDGATIIAATDHCPIAAFTLGDHVLGIQGHPEFTAEFAADVYQSRLGVYPDEVLDDAMRSLENGIDSSDVAAWMLGFLRGR